MSRWYELNLNIGNLLSAIFAKKIWLGCFTRSGGRQSHCKNHSREANMRDFGLSQELEIYEAIVRLSEEEEVYERERK